ncbi:hypothetical protein TWF481_001544 [Arthrobotrys musiformis]|uniref:Uncharacterized protein n=1 Tax=Arthrobotrys musiformis TaxID=47236 RepID=A0AAV9VTH5_9PEZI
MPPPLRSPPLPLSPPLSSPLSRQERTTVRAQWYDALEEEKDVDWYREYQYRHAALSDESFVKFNPPDNLDIVDIAIAGGDSVGMEHLLAASALGDGSVCIFSLSDSKVGSILGKSRPGILAQRAPNIGPGRMGDGVFNGIHHERGLFVDAATAHNYSAWFGAGSVLSEVDLTTMQRIRTHRFPFSVTCLSNPTPVLVVGTTLTLHLLDSRSPSDFVGTAPILSPPNPPKVGKIDPITNGLDMRRPSTPFNHENPPSLLFDNEERTSRDHLLHAPPTAFLQPSPLSILHSPIDQGGGNELYVAGRFPSIMAYDRRQWPRLAGTMHSGARLSSLAIMPTNSESSVPSKYTLIGCGEYAGRGTLELYPLPMDTPCIPDPASKKSDALIERQDQKPPSPQRAFARSTSAATRNRQSASKSKIFSVSSQGIKIVTGDSEGRIRFMERDGIRHIRDWVGPWGDGYNGGGCVKRILPILQPRVDLRPSVDNSDLLLHVGEGAGVLTFNRTFQRNRISTHIVPPDPEASLVANQDAEAYKEAMRAALEAHGSELQFLQNFGS